MDQKDHKDQKVRGISDYGLTATACRPDGLNPGPTTQRLIIERLLGLSRKSSGFRLKRFLGSISLSPS